MQSNQALKTIRLLLIKFIFISSVPTSVPSKTISFEIQSLQDREINNCILQIVYSSESISISQRLNINISSEKKWYEIEAYCKCFHKYKSWNIKNKPRYSLNISYEKLKNMDQCSLEYLSKDTREFYYQLNLITKYSVYLKEDLLKQMLPGSRQIASVNSIEKQLKCLELKIIKICSQERSLVSTSICINSITTDPERINSIKKVCPKLETFNLEIDSDHI